MSTVKHALRQTQAATEADTAFTTACNGFKQPCSSVLAAIDAMPQGGTLTLRTHDAGERARLEISDTGTGLTPEERDRIFTPYYTTKQHGTGLGLAVVQSVVSDHRGTITVNSETGRGTTFIIDLPKRTEEGSAQSGASA